MTQIDALQPFSIQAQSIELGSEYEHYKGNRYKIIAVARHSESLEENVVYQDLGGDRNVWVRPVAMFLEQLVIDGKSVSRFRKC